MPAIMNRATSAQNAIVMKTSGSIAPPPDAEVRRQAVDASQL
jgi:hypothetical protein